MTSLSYYLGATILPKSVLFVFSLSFLLRVSLASLWPVCLGRVEIRKREGRGGGFHCKWNRVDMRERMKGK